MVREGTVDGRPAFEVLEERLSSMEWPELRALGVLVLEENDPGLSAAGLWFNAIGGEHPK